MFRILTSSLLVTLSGASFCGDSAVPYSLEILSDGQPVLECARPTCFGWALSGKPATNSGSFYRINEYLTPMVSFAPAGNLSLPTVLPMHDITGPRLPLQYDVSIRRMPYADLLEPGVSSKIPKAEAAAQAFQYPILGPNVAVDQPLPLPGQNGVLEEVVQQEAIQLPAGTQFQPVPPPPPQPPIAFQSPAAAYYGAGGGGGGNAQWCFTADMTVELADGTTKRMDDLNKLDWVLTANEDQLVYEPIDYWMHRIPDQEAEFNEFEMEDGSTIKLTDKHYIYKAVPADQVRTGDCLYTLGEDRHMSEVRVVRSDKITQKGIYAPMTANGRIIVNGVHASCHNIMQTHSIGHTIFGYIDKIYKCYDRIIGSSAEVVEIPYGLSTVLAMAELVMPKNMATM